MTDHKQQDNPERDLRSIADELEVAVYQSTNVNEIREAFQIFHAQSQLHQQRMIELVSPATLVALALRGYELPDAQMRAASNDFLARLLDLLTLPQQATYAEEVLIILAGHRAILLEQIEQDIEALERSALTESETLRRQRSLTTLHKQLRVTADSFVNALFPAAEAETQFMIN